MAVAANYVVVMDGKKRLKSGTDLTSRVQYRTTLQPTFMAEMEKSTLATLLSGYA